MAPARGQVALEEMPLNRPSLVILVAVACLSVLAAPRQADAQATKQATKDADAAPAVRGVLAAQVEAWNRGDLEGYMAGYWKSPELVFFSNGQETRGWQPTLERYRARYQGAGKQMGTLDFPAMDILTLGPRPRWRVGAGVSRWPTVRS